MKYTWVFIFFILLSLAGTFFSCEKSKNAVSELSGTWVEFSNRLDTIDFDSWPSDSVFVLKRGSELINGDLLPKYGSGIYSYKQMSDTIMIQNMFWSCLCYSSYYFQMNSTNKLFIIGNFYDSTLTDSPKITFSRIK